MVEHNSIRAVIFHDRTDPYLVPMETSQGFVNATYINNAGEKTRSCENLYTSSFYFR